MAEPLPVVDCFTKPATGSPEWHNDARCTGVDPELFYPDMNTPEGRDHADWILRNKCADCPVLGDCREYWSKVVLRGRRRLADDFGIWFGTTPGIRQEFLA
jgi:hypothetical protein